MDTQKRFDLITQNTEEVLTDEHLKELISQGEKLKHYIGFEISGKVHLGTGLMSMQKVNDFQKANVDCSIFLADWHSWINDKLSGDIEFIQKAAIGYFKEGIIASLKCVGGDTEKLKFVMGSKLYHNNDEYWQTVIEVSKNTTLKRIMRSTTIMGRQQAEGIDFAKLIYPPMQVSDIFIMERNIAHAGMDQRTAHVVALEVAKKLKIKPLLNKKKEIIKPVAIHHPLILGLQEPSEWPLTAEKAREIWSNMKMSKSVPNSAVFVNDSPEEIRMKLKKAFCPAKEIEYNPVLNWVQRLVFVDQPILKIERPEKFGGNVEFESYDALTKAFQEGDVHPLDLKNAMAEFLIKKLEPARKHMDKPKIKKIEEEMMELISR